MGSNRMDFPVARGLEGMNKLALRLNAMHLRREWHFGLGTRYDQAVVTVDFDDPADLERARLGILDTQPGVIPLLIL